MRRKEKYPILWMEMPVAIRRTAKARKEARYSRRIKPKKEVGLRKLMAGLDHGAGEVIAMTTVEPASSAPASGCDARLALSMDNDSVYREGKSSDRLWSVCRSTTGSKHR